MSHQQEAVKPVVIARFFIAPNFILQSQDDSLGVCNGEWFHSNRKPHFAYMRNYL